MAIMIDNSLERAPVKQSESPCMQIQAQLQCYLLLITHSLLFFFFLSLSSLRFIQALDN